MSPPTAPPSERLRILLAEDEPDIRQYVRDILAARDDVDVVEAPSGEDALRRLEHEWFDVVVSDQRMGLVDGLAVLERARERSPDAPRVMITGYAELELVEDAKNRGHVDRFLAKPFSPDAFLDEVAPLLDTRRVRAARQLAFDRALKVP